MRLFTFDHAIQKLDLRPDAGMFSQAHPALSGRRIEGNEVRITGMSASGIIRFEMPKCPFGAVITLGDLEYVRGLDTQEIVVDLRRLVHDSVIVDILYRKMFVYEFVPLKIRRTILRRQLSRG